MRRRAFITLLGGGVAALAIPGTRARAQQGPVIGYLATSAPEQGGAGLAAFHRGLAEAGFVEGRNVTIDIRWMNGEFNRIPQLLADLLRRPPAVLYVGTPPGVRAAWRRPKPSRSCSWWARTP